MKSLCIVLAALSLAGCATLSYQEPTQGPRARVRFVTNTGAIAILRVYDDANCTQNEAEWMRLRVGNILGSTPKKLGMPLWDYHDNAAKEIYVQAGKPVHALFSGSEANYQCGVPFSFTFQDSNDYEVKYQLDGLACSVTVAQLVRKGDGWSASQLGKFYNVVTEANRGCLAQFKKTRMY
jgi:hypothetical protein